MAGWSINAIVKPAAAFFSSFSRDRTTRATDTRHKHDTQSTGIEELSGRDEGRAAKESLEISAQSGEKKVVCGESRGGSWGPSNCKNDVVFNQCR